jgi:hypothetical protein
MKAAIQNIIKMIKDFKDSPKIPIRDKWIILTIIIITLFPIIFISNWINDVGFIITLFLLSLIPDYLFNVLDQTLLLSFYPFDMKSFSHLRRAGLFLASIVPYFISDNIWEYKKEVI